MFGVGPNNIRLMCETLVAKYSAVDCQNHPHNFYLQLLGETGIVGLMTGVTFFLSIIVTCSISAWRNKDDVVCATMWIIPLAFFWPIATTADFFGQWNNIFMWSALAFSLSAVYSSDRRPL